jgi:O-antigen ligase
MGHLLSDLLVKRFTENRKEIKILGFIVLSFTSFLLIAALATNVKYVAFFGESQRNTGFLAYFFLAIFLLSAAKSIRLKNIEAVYIAGISVGALMTFYGVLQHFGNDFVKWNNPYNAVISTVGNPDFAAAILAVFLVLAFTSIFATDWHIAFKVLAGLLSLLILLLIHWSQARQGLLSFGVAGGLFLVIFIWQKNRTLGIISSIGYLIVFILGLLGIFQVGPLAGQLYKGSVSIRGFYWRAAVEMLTSHPLLGVGVDRYGAFFRVYRENQYPVNYGYDITSTAAHNVLLQIFAMGGIFVGLSYLAILGFIAYRGVVGIRKTSGKNRLLVAGVFCAWVAYEAQSIVSIDNIGIAIWGWVLGGAVIGVSLLDSQDVKLVEPEKNRRAIAKQSNVQIATPIISAVIVLIMFVVVSTQFRAESQMFNLSRYAVPTDQANRNAYHPLIRKVADIPWMNPIYKLEIGSKLAQAGFVDEGFAEIEKVIAEDPQSYAGLGLAASFYEQLKKFDKAAPLREKMYLLDPWGAQNLLTLGNDYLQLGQKDKAKEMGQKILAMKSSEAVRTSAKTQLGA